ncbi:MAG: hypothetical protein B7Z15_08355 [Rhizobiales bacterium 32-66-8]|nr:MAG: hypothetical protein B7Z15_08355 [Rhizobiales bacterium 32-66-8]
MPCDPQEPPSPPAAAPEARRAGAPAGLKTGATLMGIALMCVATTTFAITDTTAKWLAGHINVWMVVWTRYVIHFAVAFLVFNPWTVPGLLRTRRPGLQLLRSALLFTTTALNFTALQYLQLDQTVSIMFSTPFFVAVFAGPMLGEWVGMRRWAAILVGFAGILLVAQPSTGGDGRADRHAAARRAQTDGRGDRCRDHHLVLFRAGGITGGVPAAAVRLGNPAGTPGLCRHAGTWRGGRSRAFPAHHRPCAGASRHARALHLYPDPRHAGAGLAGIRGQAEPLDAVRGGGGDRLRHLSAGARAARPRRGEPTLSGATAPRQTHTELRDRVRLPQLGPERSADGKGRTIAPRQPRFRQKGGYAAQHIQQTDVPHVPPTPACRRRKHRRSPCPPGKVRRGSRKRRLCPPAARTVSRRGGGHLLSRRRRREPAGFRWPCRL